VHVEGAAVLHCTSRESLLRRARSSWIARSWRDGLDVHSLDEWSNRGEALVGRVALIETGGSVSAANDQTIIYLVGETEPRHPLPVIGLIATTVAAYARSRWCARGYLARINYLACAQV